MNTFFHKRYPDNVVGNFYVTWECTDCDLCRVTAPNNFFRNDEGGYSYVKNQPVTPEEETLCREAVEGCPCEAIYADGDQFDWTKIPADSSPEYHQPCACHSKRERPWWKFW